MLFVVAVPVRNERDRVADCLRALVGQADVRHADIRLLIFLNNCTDGTRGIVEDFARISPCPIRILEEESALASAGWARRKAMDAAAAWLAETPERFGVILTTDADSQVARNWVSLNRASLMAGADAVAGRVAFDPLDIAMLPASLRERQNRELIYETLLAEIEAKLNPHRGNPWPCHWTKSGASIAVKLEAYHRVGGLPPIDSGEDHAFIDVLRAHGLVVRQAPEIVVTTSGRLEGRARGGTAETLRRRSIERSCVCDSRLERAAPFAFRLLRSRLSGKPTLKAGNRAPFRQAMDPHELPFQIRCAQTLLRLIAMLVGRRGDSRASGSGLSPRPKRLSMP